MYGNLVKFYNPKTNCFVYIYNYTFLVLSNYCSKCVTNLCRFRVNENIC